MEWRKSSFSGSASNCVEVRQDHKGVRDSKNPAVELPIGRTAWHALLRIAAR